MLHQITPLGMAGLAEAAEEFALMIAWGGVLFAAIATFVAMSKRSWIPVLLSVIVVAGVTVLFMPWTIFAKVSAGASEDPDVRYWFDAWRVLAIGWIIVVVLTVSSAVVVAVKRSRRAS